jgi:hypothetical protein
MPGGERQEVHAAAGQDHDLPDDGNPQPAFQSRAHLVELVRAQGSKQQAVVEAVLNEKGDQERDKAEP